MTSRILLCGLLICVVSQAWANRESGGGDPLAAEFVLIAREIAGVLPENSAPGEMGSIEFQQKLSEVEESLKGKWPLVFFPEGETVDCFGSPKLGCVREDHRIRLARSGWTLATNQQKIEVTAMEMSLLLKKGSERYQFAPKIRNKVLAHGMERSPEISNPYSSQSAGLEPTKMRILESAPDSRSVQPLVARLLEEHKNFEKLSSAQASVVLNMIGTRLLANSKSSCVEWNKDAQYGTNKSWYGPMIGGQPTISRSIAGPGMIRIDYHEKGKRSESIRIESYFLDPSHTFVSSFQSYQFTRTMGPQYSGTIDRPTTTFERSDWQLDSSLECQNWR